MSGTAGTSLKDTIAREIDGLSEESQENVLAFIRFMRMGLGDSRKVEHRFTVSIEAARRIAAERKIGDADVEAEVSAVRTGG